MSKCWDEASSTFILCVYSVRAAEAQVSFHI